MDSDHAPAVVLGASFAGLLAARVLAGHYPQVIIIERDRLPGRPAHRRGTPQDRHVHALFPGGLAVVEELLPGYTAAFQHAGGHVIDVGEQMILAHRHGWMLRSASDTYAAGSSRPLLEHVMRRMVLDLPGIHLMQAHQAEALGGGSRGVEAVMIRPADRPAAFRQPAALVVDATGRGSRLPARLGSLGCDPVPQTTVDAHIGYASRLYQIPDAAGQDWRACYVMETGPHVTRGGVIAPYADGLNIVTLTGVGADRPTGTAQDFLPFARSLITPVIADTLTTANPMSPVTCSRSTSGNMRHWGRVRNLPANVFALGDAACALNPLYAQGMTAAALGARHLAACLAAYGPGSPRLARAYHRGLARIHWPLWLLSTSSDLRYPGTEGPAAGAAQRALTRYVERVLAATTRDAHARSAFLDVMTMVQPPTALLAPRILAASLFRGSQGPGPAQEIPDRRSPARERYQ